MSLTLRSTKGSKLSIEEMDSNLTYLDDKRKYGVFAFLTQPTNTTITTAGTYYPILGTFTNNPMIGFYISGMSIKYGEVGLILPTSYFEIDWHASVTLAPLNSVVKCAIKKNDVVLESSIMETFATTIIFQMSGTCVVELEDGDEIQLVVTSDGDDDVVTFERYTTTIGRFL